MIYLELFTVFVKIGFCCFGGLAMIPVISAEMVSHAWLTLDEVADIVAIAEMTPGAIGINSATFAGMKMAGVSGAVVASLGVMVPSLTLCLLAGFFLQKLKGNPLLDNALRGIRPVCMGMIASVVVTMSIENFFPQGAFCWQALLIAAAVFLLQRRFHAGVPVQIGFAAVLGLILFSI
ncbi:chromate transporter [Feifania hominis]|uniref:Chromate transporter n=1 Tax=Feifania hominis TaxID=2763660 RepID=A0A926DCC8_9FIRM|nr:chromate transporter [Feifania hominis]